MSKNYLPFYISGSVPLDREVQDKYTLIVQAYDNYHFGFTTGESRNSFAQVIVSITDVNDQIPVFEEDYVDKPENQHNCAIINEFHDTNEAILTARAKDGDDPRTPNGVVEFSIDSGKDYYIDGLRTLVAKIGTTLPSILAYSILCVY